MAGSYYSFELQATAFVVLNDPHWVLEPGLNVETAVVEDIEALRETLRSQGVTIVKENQLDNLEPVLPVQDGLLLPE